MTPSPSSEPQAGTSRSGSERAGRWIQEPQPRFEGTGRPAKAEYRELPGRMAEGARAGGFQTGLGMPIVADGTIWGAIVTGTEEEALPKGAEERFTAFTELVAVAISNAKAREDLRRVVEEQASLRRVATLVAQEASQAEVFAAVAEEVATTLGVRLTAVIRFEPDGTATQVGVWGAENPFPVGTSWDLDELSVSGRVAKTGRPARVDYTQVPGEIAATLAREAGIRSAVGVPVLVDGKPWGSMMALSSEDQALAGPDRGSARRVHGADRDGDRERAGAGRPPRVGRRAGGSAPGGDACRAGQRCCRGLRRRLHRDRAADRRDHRQPRTLHVGRVQPDDGRLEPPRNPRADPDTPADRARHDQRPDPRHWRSGAVR